MTMYGKNSKERLSYLLLQKHEWNRLKKQSGPPEELSNEQNEYVKSLTEKSNAWTSTWPDHEHGRIAMYEQERQRQHEADLATTKASSGKKNSKTRKHNEEAIKEAKEKIFQESCYGQKLVCALRESKALEERDVQLQFLKELKQNKELQTKEIEPGCTFALDKRAADEDKVRKCKVIQAAQQNKEMHEKHQAEIAIAKVAQIHEDLENTHLTKKMLDLEAEAEEKVKLLEKEALQQYLADRKESKKEHTKREAEYHAKIELCQKEKDKLSCKIKQVLQDIHKGAYDLPWAKKNYETFKQRQEAEIRKYKELEETNNKTREESSANQERELKEKERQDFEKRLTIAEINKTMAEYEKLSRCPNANKCVCERQSLFVKSHDCNKKEITKSEEKSSPHFGPCNKLSSELNKRMQEPPPWTGVKAAHDEFARHADNTLKECKYKNPGRKVVDEYVKTNGLTTIEIPHYY